jgi:hypothetical protein
MAIAVLLGVAAFLCLLLAPSSVDDVLAAAREKSRRYRSAALVCFSVAVLIYTVVATVACALVPFAACHAWRTAQLDSDPYE